MSRGGSGRSRADIRLAESHHRDESMGTVTISAIRKADRKRNHLPRSHDEGLQRGSLVHEVRRVL